MDATEYPQTWAVTYNLDRWAGRRITSGGWATGTDGRLPRTGRPAMVSLVDSSGWKHVDLVVISPDTSPEIAERTLRLAGEDDDLHRADEIVRLSANGGSAMGTAGTVGSAGATR